MPDSSIWSISAHFWIWEIVTLNLPYGDLTVNVNLRLKATQYDMNILRYVTLHFRDRRGAASLRYRNRAEIIVLMCEPKLYLVWLSCRRKSNPVRCKHSLKLTNIITLLKSRSQHQFWGSPKKREFGRVPKPTPQKFEKRVRERNCIGI